MKTPNLGMFCLISSERKVQSWQIWSRLKDLSVLYHTKVSLIILMANMILYNAQKVIKSSGTLIAAIADYYLITLLCD